MSPQSFLHEKCKAHMCSDCINIAEEYQELEDRRKLSQMKTVRELERVKQDIARERRKSDMFESVAKAGVGEVIAAWIDQEIRQILDK